MSPEENRVIASRRMFDATPETVWEAFRNPDALARWWGPLGFGNEFHAFEFRPGGEWDFTMKGPDGGTYRMRKVFVELRERERLVLDHPDTTHGFRMIIELAKNGNSTEMTWRMTFDSAEEAARVRSVVETSNEQNLDRLADYLSEARA